MIVLDGYASVTEESYCLGEYFPLRLLHYAALKRFGGIALLYLNGLLKDYRSCITLGGNDMDGCAGYLYALFKCRLVDVQTVKALAGEGG